MNSREYARRRRTLQQQMADHSLAIVPAAPHPIRNRDVEYPYHPDSDFYYLTGFAEAEALLLLKRVGRKFTWMLFCQERNPEMEQWTGERLGTERAVTELGAHQAWPIEQWEKQLPELLTGVEQLYFNLGDGTSVEQALLKQLKQFRQRNRAGVVFPLSIHTLDPLLHEMRLIKSSAELKAMRKAATISAQAHRHAMQQCHIGMSEQQLEGEILHQFNQQGSRTVAYDTIVAGGNNACTLHYIQNSEPLNDGDLVLIDAGTEWAGYAADITRTFPINGRFTTPQRQLYEIVLAAQQAAINQVQPGKRWNAPHQAAVRVITQGLLELKILKGELKQLIKEEKYKPFYMHQTGHWLGMDVHDVGQYKIDGKWRLLQPGMVMTVEPGLYIPHGMKGVAKKWWEIGIRIEDDIVVTEEGCEVLTSDAPKGVKEIELWMEKSSEAP
ncbi:MAG: Xaa-Pro aminopeptidase [Thiotrichales bacterium]|nr:Xaa-Pro aminopeptidase [Thiotrichales bacterium]